MGKRIAEIIVFIVQKSNHPKLDSIFEEAEKIGKNAQNKPSNEKYTAQKIEKPTRYYQRNTVTNCGTARSGYEVYQLKRIPRHTSHKARKTFGSNRCTLHTDETGEPLGAQKELDLEETVRQGERNFSTDLKTLAGETATDSKLLKSLGIPKKENGRANGRRISPIQKVFLQDLGLYFRTTILSSQKMQGSQSSSCCRKVCPHRKRLHQQQSRFGGQEWKKLSKYV